ASPGAASARSPPRLPLCRRSSTPCSMPERGVASAPARARMNDRRRMAGPARGHALYFPRVLCRDRRRAQTFALSLNDDLGDAMAAWRAGPPTSGKPEGRLASPLEPRVQGRFARIDMAEDDFFSVTGPARSRAGAPG